MKKINKKIQSCAVQLNFFATSHPLSASDSDSLLCQRGRANYFCAFGIYTRFTKE